jgi:hypothetical protein
VQGGARAGGRAGQEGRGGAEGQQAGTGDENFRLAAQQAAGPRAGLGDMHGEQPGDQQRAEDRRMPRAGRVQYLQPQQCRAADLLPGQQPHEAQRGSRDALGCGQEESLHRLGHVLERQAQRPGGDAAGGHRQREPRPAGPQQRGRRPRDGDDAQQQRRDPRARVGDHRATTMARRV